MTVTPETADIPQDLLTEGNNDRDVPQDGWQEKLLTMVYSMLSDPRLGVGGLRDLNVALRGEF